MLVIDKVSIIVEKLLIAGWPLPVGGIGVVLPVQVGHVEDDGRARVLQ